MTAAILNSQNDQPSNWRERTSTWLLGGPLAVLLGLLAVAQLASWAPQYLSWPWWSDHDAYATVAFGWHLGKLPYRDLLCNNFPGQIYVFYVLGRLFGWGWTPSIYLFDAALVAVLGGVLVLWSKRLWGSAIPGLVGWLSFAGYYFELDYSQTAQRDWQGPCFAVLGLLLLQIQPGRAGRIASAALLAAGLAFRPQVVFFAPAFLYAIVRDDGFKKLPNAGQFKILLEWFSSLALAFCIAFAPLLIAGVGGDFVQGVRKAGTGWNNGGLGTIVKGFLVEATNLKLWIVAAALGLVGAQSSARRYRGISAVWIVALLGVLFYRPLSPIQHAYLKHPLTLVWTINAAVVSGFIIHMRNLAPSLRLTSVLFVLAMQASGRPTFCNPDWAPIALKSLMAKQDPEPSPLGYRHNLSVQKAPPYHWRDYRNMLAYLRMNVSEGTHVANVLLRMPAVTGPVARLPVFPAESLEWLLVDPTDEFAFAQALSRDEDSVVVWAPNQVEVEPSFQLELLEPVVRKNYELEVRFGSIEVWRRKRDAVDASLPPKTHPQVVLDTHE